MRSEDFNKYLESDRFEEIGDFVFEVMQSTGDIKIVLDFMHKECKTDEDKFMIGFVLGKSISYFQSLREE